MQRTNAQNKKFWALVKAAGIDRDTVSQMVYQVSDGRTDSTKLLSFDEMKWLIQLVADIDEQKHSKSRASVVHLLCLMVPQRYQTEQGNPDMAAINRTVTKLSTNTSGKPLYHLTGSELNNVVGQVKAIYKKETNK